MHLIRKCPCPVWLVDHRHDGRFNRILAAVDPAPDQTVFNADRDDLNRKIMMYSSFFARMTGATVHVVHCWQQPLEERLKQVSEIFKPEIKRILQNTRKRHKQWLTNLMRDLAPTDLSFNTHLLKGKADHILPRLATKYDIDLLVMGSVHHARENGVLIGGNTEKILHQLQWSLLACKPEGFVSPVSSKNEPVAARAAGKRAKRPAD
jgi:nucleotide-binding universal stress UspA family protein